MVWSECVIDTAAIRTWHDAKEGPPPCAHVAPGVGLCEIMISSNAASYKGDYYPMCPGAHGCDATCGFPCGDGVPPPPPLEAVCDTDASGYLCPLSLSAGTNTYENIFCTSCEVIPGADPSHER
jgi:hypothetical protein